MVIDGSGACFKAYCTSALDEETSVDGVIDNLAHPGDGKREVFLRGAGGGVLGPQIRLVCEWFISANSVVVLLR